jgi:hypothetical protein
VNGDVRGVLSSITENVVGSTQGEQRLRKSSCFVRDIGSRSRQQNTATESQSELSTEGDVGLFSGPISVRLSDNNINALFIV